MGKFIGFLNLAFAILFIFTGDIWPGVIAAGASMIWFALAGIEKHSAKSERWRDRRSPTGDRHGKWLDRTQQIERSAGDVAARGASICARSLEHPALGHPKRDQAREMRGDHQSQTEGFTPLEEAILTGKVRLIDQDRQARK